MQIGPHLIPNNLFVAPMAGVTDRPFRQLCKQLGAGLAVSEMMSSQPHLRESVKSRRRADHSGEAEPICVQIAGADPAMLADAARYNVGLGAQVIDINMGCPAKKVCNVLAGSALLRDEPLVGRILDAVVGAVDVPVTLKIRTGWDPQQRNAVRVARIAQSAGIRLARGPRQDARLRVRRQRRVRRRSPRSRTRSRFRWLPTATSTRRRRRARCLPRTGADAVMIGRAAQGRPWIFREIRHFLRTGEHLPPPETAEIAPAPARASAGAPRLLRRGVRRAGRPQARRLVHQTPRGERAVPAAAEPAGTRQASRSRQWTATSNNWERSTGDSPTSRRNSRHDQRQRDRALRTQDAGRLLPRPGRREACARCTTWSSARWKDP